MRSHRKDELMEAENLKDRSEFQENQLGRVQFERKASGLQPEKGTVQMNAHPETENKMAQIDRTSNPAK